MDSIDAEPAESTVLARHGFLIGSLVVLATTGAFYAFLLKNVWAGGVSALANGDRLSLAAILLSASDTPLFGVDDKAGLVSSLRQQELGLLTTLVMRAVSPLDLNAAQLTVVAAIPSAFLVAWTIYAVATPLVRSRMAAIVLALAVILSPFCIWRAAGHMGIMAAYLPVAAIGAVTIAPYRRRFILLTLVFGLLSTPWWQAATSVLIAAALLVAVLARNRQVVMRTVWTGVALIPGLGMTILLAARSSDSGHWAPSREPWDSNRYGGHLMDLLANAPLVDRIRGIDYTDLSPGFSLEVPGFGSVAVLFVLIVLAFHVHALARPETGERDADADAEETRALHIVAIAVVGTFVAGGFGNLQAGVAVILNGESPARVWSRLIILVALVAGLYALRPLREAPRALAVAMLASTLVIAVGDFWLSGAWGKPDAHSRDFGLSRSQVAKFTASGCTVVHVPLATFPVVRAPKGATPAFMPFYYQDLRLYLTYPNLRSTAGSPLLKGGKPALGRLLADLQEDPSSKYCGYLIDRDYARHLDKFNKLTKAEQTVYEKAPKTDGRYVFVPMD